MKRFTQKQRERGSLAIRNLSEKADWLLSVSSPWDVWEIEEDIFDDNDEYLETVKTYAVDFCGDFREDLSFKELEEYLEDLADDLLSTMRKDNAEEFFKDWALDPEAEDVVSIVVNRNKDCSVTQFIAVSSLDEPKIIAESKDGVKGCWEEFINSIKDTPLQENCYENNFNDWLIRNLGFAITHYNGLSYTLELYKLKGKMTIINDGEYVVEDCEKMLTWNDLSDSEKEAVIGTYMFVITETEGKQCSRKRAEENIVTCLFEKKDTGDICVYGKRD